MKELYVKFKYEEDDSYVELWQVCGNKKYIGRYTYGPQKEWVYVADPLGYREMDYSLHDDVTVIVCNQKGKELFRTRNGDESVNFNTPKQEAFEQFARYCKEKSPKVKVENQSAIFFVHWASGTPVGNFNQWLLSFQDPDVYPEAHDYAENWLWCKNEKVGEPETLSSYSYLGQKKLIERIRYRHKVCGVEWDEYYSGDYYIGASFDETNVGTMYSEAQAKKLVSEAIKSNFPDRDKVSFVREYRPSNDSAYYREERLDIRYAAERLIDRDLHRSNIDRIVADERKCSHFFANTKEAQKQYPECIPYYG